MLTIQLGEKTYTYEVLMVTEHATKENADMMFRAVL